MALPDRLPRVVWKCRYSLRHGVIDTEELDRAVFKQELAAIQKSLMAMGKAGLEWREQMDATV